MTTGAPRAIALIRFYRSLPENLRPKAILVGGWHAMDNPQEMLEAGADVVVHGEAEVIIKDLLTALRDGKSLDGIPGISYWSDNQIKRNGPVEIFVPQKMMDELPDPDFGLVRYSKIKIFPLGRTRGCDGKCTFCRVNCPPRSISPEHFLEQLKILISKGARDIFITDDRAEQEPGRSEQDFEGYTYWLKGLAEFIRERRVHVSLTTQNRLSLANHPEILQLMRAAGVDNVAIGYESPIPALLRAMQKPINPKKMLEWTRVWKKHGFAIHMMKIFGYPISPQKRKDLDKQGLNYKFSAKELGRIYWDFIRKAKPHTLQVLLFTPLYGTKDRKFLEEQGRILPLDNKYADGTWLMFIPDEWIDPKELVKEYIRLMRKFYAFHYLWWIAYLPITLHSIKVGLVTLSYPIVRPIIGRRSWRKAWLHSLHLWIGNRIIADWLKNFRKLRFIENLTNMIRRKNI